ncbi:putrescine--2-oxoglutarate aminotransferase [Pelotomaculum schinkii]|uniref:Putrescine--2-oxoglutarate aminotransferase n=1 Tax=Pelotomaculum schinkii TaxID=78350 RepID=A0A4Y7R974_9FIRM|nr:putrescine--2-oxoglutarate aminotransferase [Pelotomaculum schinkii]TEB09570.1 putrescine--2-oxoglutarate aminotransferase [Pelotomaculum sp. FP]
MALSILYPSLSCSCSVSSTLTIFRASLFVSAFTMARNLLLFPPRIIDAVNQVKGVPNLLQASTLSAALAKNLALAAPGDLRRSFFGNSGAEAVEGALKQLDTLLQALDKVLAANKGFFSMAASGAKTMLKSLIKK